jgi:hypothetical protein
MSFLWSLINSLQICVRTPLMNIVFPDFCKSFFSVMFVVTNFDMIPSSYLNQLLFDQNQTAPLNYRFEEMDIF